MIFEIISRVIVKSLFLDFFYFKCTLFRVILIVTQLHIYMIKIALLFIYDILGKSLVNALLTHLFVII